MYTFSKSSWHVKLFKWIFDTDPTRTYKSMCPYFWTYVLIFLFFPLVLIVKMFGIYGTKLLNTLRTYKETQREKEVEKFIAKFNKTLTDKEILSLVFSKCYKNYNYHLDWNLQKDLERRYYQLIYARDDKRDNFRKEVKESKSFIFISTFVTTLIVIAVFGFAFYLLSLVPWVALVDPLILIMKVIPIVVICAAIIFGLVYLMTIGIEKLKCMECKLCKLPIFSGIGNGFKFIFSGFGLVGDMIYVTYKKNCPLITWKE